MDNIIMVSVIASFDTDGHIKPLYVRVDEESLKVVSCWMKPAFVSSCTYQCKVEDHGVLKPLVLTYHMNESVWSIPKY